MKPHIEHTYAACIGIDWADQKHDICLQAAHADTQEYAVLAHLPDAIEAWALSLKQRFHGQPGGTWPA